MARNAPRTLATLITEAGDARTADKNLPIAKLWKLLDAAITLCYVGNSIDDGTPVKGAAAPYASQRGDIYGGGSKALDQIIADLGLDPDIVAMWFDQTSGYGAGDGLADYFNGDGSTR